MKGACGDRTAWGLCGLPSGHEGACDANMVIDYMQTRQHVGEFAGVAIVEDSSVPAGEMHLKPKERCCNRYEPAGYCAGGRVHPDYCPVHAPHGTGGIRHLVP